MEILDQFGFDLRLFGAQIINFLILVFVFKKFLYKPLIKVLENREKKIAQGMQDAENAQKALLAAQEQENKIIKKAGLEAERILLEAKSQSDQTKNDLLNKTKEEIAKMMEQTKAQIKLEKENFKKESKEITLEAAKTILQSTIRELFDKKEGDIIVKKGLQKIKNV